MSRRSPFWSPAISYRRFFLRGDDLVLSFPFLGSLRGSTLRKASRAWLKERAGGFRVAVLGTADSFDVIVAKVAGKSTGPPWAQKLWLPGTLKRPGKTPVFGTYWTLSQIRPLCIIPRGARCGWNAEQPRDLVATRGLACRLGMMISRRVNPAREAACGYMGRLPEGGTPAKRSIIDNMVAREEKLPLR
jgi:hypothetical protein